MTDQPLHERECSACRGDEPPLQGEEISALLQDLSGWDVKEKHHLAKEFSFKNFRKALDFANRVGALAEEENHHPELVVSWGSVIVRIWTHTVGGLTDNDFILAAKIDRLECS